jgi:protein-disulfide isomerase
MRSLPARALLLIALSLPLAASGARPAPASAAERAAPAGHDWLGVARRTPEGAIVIGNPAAKVKLVEYLSLTCPHCAALSTEAMEPLRRDYIAPGLVSLEVRHAVRDGYDFVASLLLRCEPAPRYLASIEALYASQGQWMAQAMNAPAAPGFEALTPEQKMAAAARAAGFPAFFEKRGMTPRSFAACMADAGGKEQLTRMADNSWRRDAIPGTPTIEINGKREDQVDSWAELRPLIVAALK